MMQEKVDRCESPSSMGRIPHKIASSFSSFTADQWKTWTMVFSMYALHGVLEQEHLECWYLFVQACNIIVSPMLNINDAMEGHKFTIAVLQSSFSSCMVGIRLRLTCTCIS